MRLTYKRTKEQNLKHSQACKGKTGKWKRKKRQNKIMSERLKGRVFSEEHLKKLKEALKKRWDEGDLMYKISPIRRANKQRRNLIPLKDGLSRKKDKNGNWGGGITDKNALIRSSKEYEWWRKRVFERDNYTCQMPKCGLMGCYLNAHHIKTFEKHPELRFDINNGITLCKKCHNKTKRKEKQFEEIFYEILNKL